MTTNDFYLGSLFRVSKDMSGARTFIACRNQKKRDKILYRLVEDKLILYIEKENNIFQYNLLL